MGSPGSSAAAPPFIDPSGYVAQEFEADLKCGRLEEGFLRVRCERRCAEKLVAFSCRKRGFCPSCGARGMGAAKHPPSDAVQVPPQPKQAEVPLGARAPPVPSRFI